MSQPGRRRFAIAPRRSAWALAAVAATTVACSPSPTGLSTPLQTVAEVTRLDRRSLEQGRAIEIEATTVFHDPSWERLIVQENGHCVAVDAAGIDPALSPGERVRVSGFTAFERNGPMIVLPRIARLPARGPRTWQPANATAPLLPDEGLECLEIQARVRGARQLDSEHLRLVVDAGGHEVEGIVMDIANSALLREGDTVVLRGPVESIQPADGAPVRWRMYLQGAGAFERLGGTPPAPPPRATAERATAPLTGLLQVKMLSAEEAGRGLPVRVRGVVTGASARASNGAQELILQDADCGLYATTETPTDAARFGALVELEGRTAPGAFAPIIVYSALRVVGEGPLPRPLPAAQLGAGLSARTENVWSVATGVLRPQAESLVVATPDGELPLFFFTDGNRSLQHLVDAEVQVAGVFAVIHRARRVVGYRLLVQSPEQIAVTRAITGRETATAWPIAQLFRYWPSGRPLHRLSIRGTVTGVFHPDRVYVDDGTAGVVCETVSRPRIGAVVTASGFLPVSDPEHRLTRAQLHEAGAGAGAATASLPPLLAIDEVFGGEHDGRLLRIDGRLRERTRSMGRDWLTLEAGPRTISAVLESPVPAASVERLRVGSELRVTGIGDMDWDHSHVPPRVRGARLLLRTPGDIEVIRAASWWTRGRIAGVLVTVLALAAASLVWTVALRRQVGSQTRLIRDQLASLREQSDERERAKGGLEKSLAEQRSLLREVHHRVKNNLQAIIHLVEIERDRIDDANTRSLLDMLRQRAETMALVYEQVYQSPSVARVDMATYLGALGGRLRELLRADRPIEVVVDADHVSLDVAQAMPCGLIVNELVTNAFKHAFPPGVPAEGRITIGLTQAPGTVRLEVADDGIGLSDGQSRTGAVGLELVSLWATHQLGGRLTVRRDKGTAFIVEFGAAEAGLAGRLPRPD
jgi:two-component sensor histidine kinase